MINQKVLKALEDTDELIKEELKQSAGTFTSEKIVLRDARDRVQEAITCIFRGA